MSLNPQDRKNWHGFLDLLQPPAGYRLVAASGIALSTDQIPQYISDINGIKAIDVISTGSISLDLALGVGGVPRGRVGCGARDHDR